MGPKRSAAPHKSPLKKAKSEFSLQQLYEECVTQDDELLRQRALRNAIGDGAIAQIYEVMSSIPTPRVGDPEWIRACYLLANIMSWDCREGCANGREFDFWGDKDVLVDCLGQLCDSPHTDLRYLTIVVHFLIITWSTLQAKASVKPVFLVHVAGERLWHWMPDRRRELELERNPQIDIGNKPETVPFIVRIIGHILTLLESGTLNTATNGPSHTEKEAKEKAPDYHITEWTFLHRSLELIIDLLVSIDARSHLALYLDSMHFIVRCRMAIGTVEFSLAHEHMYLTQQLLERIHQLVRIPMKDGKMLTKVDAVSMYHRRGVMLQKMCFRHFARELPDIIYSGVGVLCNGSDFVRRTMAALKDEELLELLHKMRLLEKNGGGQENHCREFLLQVLEDYLTAPTDALEYLQSLPLYPTEQVLWDFSKIPPSHSSLLPASNVLSLPKLQRQYLSYPDYLYRHFEVNRLESAYEIRSDLVDVLKRVKPVVRQSMELEGDDEVAKFRTEFTGWARMALEVSEQLRITKVETPKLGEGHPRLVTADIGVDLTRCGESIRREWDELGEFDNIFLVHVDASKMKNGNAPLLRDYHLSNGSHLRFDTDSDKRVPDIDDRTFPERHGVQAVRGCMILSVRDTDGTIVSEPGSPSPKGTKRIFRVALDPAQYSIDAKSPLGSDIYRSMNLIVRRQGRENNFKSVLETIRGLMKGSGSINTVLPPWLRPALLGHGNPADAHVDSDILKDYVKTTVCLSESDAAKAAELIKAVPGASIKFTSVQKKAIRAGLLPGLSLVVGPPGTGKTDVAVQIIASLYQTYPTQRTVIITHSNAALNDIFEKVMSRGDIDERYIIRLGAGERDLIVESTHDFTKAGRVAHSLSRRALLLEEVQKLSESLSITRKEERGADEMSSYTCETSGYFLEHHVEPRIRAYIEGNSPFPFAKYFDSDESISLDKDNAYLNELRAIFLELEEYRPLELLRSARQRSDYLLMKQARIVAMTCTHAAIARSHLIELGFEYDNLVIEEAGQMTDIETFIPMLLQRNSPGSNAMITTRLKRISILGDHHQLPPVIKNMAFARYSGLDQSLFARLIRLGFPYIQLDMQGRARSEIADLYRWRYNDLGDLDHIESDMKYKLANPGFAHTMQLIDVGDFEGKGETTPTSFFYQNIGEAEYVVATFQYMVFLGHPPETISILTTYNGQKELIQNILAVRCGEGTPLHGMRPRAVSTVDQYQGQQNDTILLSLVRTQSVGHLRDVRRLVVAVSRARLGLYIFARKDLFADCFELKKTFDQLLKRPTKLQIVTGENYPSDRKVGDKIDPEHLFEVDDVSHMGALVYQMQRDLVESMQT